MAPFRLKLHMRKRADLILVERGLFASRARAQAAIAAGLVSADGETVRKASDAIAEDARIEASAPHPWASRGGVKLAAALIAFDLDPLDSREQTEFLGRYKRDLADAYDADPDGSLLFLYPRLFIYARKGKAKA